MPVCSSLLAHTLCKERYGDREEHLKMGLLPYRGIGDG